MRKIRSFLLKKPVNVVCWVLFTVGVGFFAPLKSFILQWIIDSDSVGRALMCLVFGVIVTVCSHVLELLCRSTYTKMACQALDGIRSTVMSWILARSLQQAQREEDASYIATLSADMRVLYDEYFMPLFNVVFWGAILLCAVAMYLFVSPVLLIVVGVMSVPPLILPKILNQRLSRAREAYSAEAGRYTHRIKEILAGYETIRLFGREEEYNRIHEQASSDHAKSEEVVQQSINTTIIASSFLGNGTFIVILFFGMLQVFAGHISMGYMVTASQLANFIIQPCQYISQNYARLRSTKSIRDRIEEMLMIVETNEEKNNERIVGRDIVCDQVCFSYPDTSKVVLRDLGLHVYAGEKVALIGESGCGKSTLAKLLSKYYSDYDGSIRIGGSELSSISRQELYEKVGYISQKTFLFDDTIYNNICLYESFPDEKVQYAVNVSGLAEYVQSLDDGLETRITENGRNLSGGQAQRIGIARVALRDYQIILADEITASLDEKTTSMVMEKLLSLDATMIAITHDTQSDSMKRFDHVYRMESGKVVEADPVV